MFHAGSNYDRQGAVMHHHMIQVCNDACFISTNLLLKSAINLRGFETKKNYAPPDPLFNPLFLFFYSKTQIPTLIHQMKGNTHPFSQSPFFLLISLTSRVHYATAARTSGLPHRHRTEWMSAWARHVIAVPV